MGSIIYKKGSLFDAPKGVVLLHACNAQGVWGSGIAKEFKIRFPEAFNSYHVKCQLQPVERMVGNGFIVLDGDQHVGCLITSRSYGNQVDKPEQIVAATKRAISGLFGEQPEGRDVGLHLHLSGGAGVAPIHIHSPKINSGLFRVPWEQTEAVIEDAIKNRGDVTWTVWEQ